MLFTSRHSTETLPRYPFSEVAENGAFDRSQTPSTLPRYSVLFNELFGASADTVLVSPSDARTVHKFHLSNKHQNWLTLAVRSTASSSKSLPRFSAGDKVAGKVTMELANAESISAIDISVRCRVITGVKELDNTTILNYCVPIWSRTQGDPRRPDSNKFNGKLSGTYTWPFSFQVPTEIKSNGTTLPLPHSFHERSSGVSIQYSLVLRVSRGKLRTDSKLQTNILFIPNITPSPFSIIQQLAYQRNRPIPDPETDPSGWVELPSVMMRGQILRTRDAVFQCTLYLAKPLSFARGSFIPCYLSLKGRDTQALDLVANPTSPVVVLRRSIKFPAEGSNVLEEPKKGRSYKEEKENVEMAVFIQPPNDIPTASNERRLYGEIHLGKRLQPSSNFDLFLVEYSVDVLPFESVTFIPQDEDTLLSYPIEIATNFPSGAVPLPLTSRPLETPKHIGAGDVQLWQDPHTTIGMGFTQ